MEKEQENKIIKDRLYYYLEKQNLTINRLAQLSNLRQSTLNNLINRNTIPSIATLRMICEGLGITVTEFLDISPYNQKKLKKINKVNQNELEEQVKKMSEEIEELKRILNK